VPIALVLGRAGRGDDGSVHDGARAHEQTLLPQVGVDLVEQRSREVVVVEQAPELQQRRGVWDRLARQVDAHEVAQRLAVVQRVLQRLVGQAVPLLKTVHAQHLRHADGLAPDASALRVQGLDHGHQARPRHDALHLGEKLLAPGALLLHRVLGAGKAALAHVVVAVKFSSPMHACAVPEAVN